MSESLQNAFLLLMLMHVAIADLTVFTQVTGTFNNAVRVIHPSAVCFRMTSTKHGKWAV